MSDRLVNADGAPTNLPTAIVPANPTHSDRIRLTLSRLTRFDVARICGYVISTGALLTPEALDHIGLSQSLAAHVSTDVGRLVLLATLVSNVLKNPSPPAGSYSAVVPRGTVPVVQPADPPAVAVVEPTSTR